ncbi:MCE family protein [Rhodococcus sp. IEGM 1408]|uniref:MCE family protein n=1 Tax=Rhodococcus sp. IEGM 1408 TaxID=3082220 RepID=UPI0029545CD7|nr:MCE family protein [Rhodococcus sp. IEGM 1408]MDV8001289.1 MCE family protein [Rhodococcus sp. IEGM 1408]
MSKTLRTQLIAFCVIAALGISYVGAKYVRLPSLFGIGQYQVFLDLPDTGGVFTNAAVNYRGTPVGRVGELTLTDDGVRVELDLDSSTPEIPADTVAVVANRSAIGEQFVDLRPNTYSEPYLKDGDVISGGGEALPVRVEDLLSSVDVLARSVPLDDLEVTVDELGKAFEGRGPQLQRLSDSLITISDSGIRTMPQLQALIRDGATVLDTQSDQSGEIISFSRDLRAVTEALRDSDSDLDRLITTAPEFADETRRLVENSGEPLTRAVGNLSTTMKTVDPLAPSFKVLLQLLPALAAGGLSVAPGDGTIHFGLVMEVGNPTPCTQGYEGTQRIIDEIKAQNPSFDPQEQNFPPNYDAKCTVPLGSPTAVRGAERVEYAHPDVPQPWDAKPKIDPDRLNLSVAAEQLAVLQGLIPR